MNEKKYNEEGYLIVSELDTCPLWKLGSESGTYPATIDCFYCKFTDFRTPVFIRRAKEIPRGEKLYSVCRNEKNRKKENES